MMIFRGWQKTSLIEYPGKVSTVLYTPGCNFRCPFCYNTDLLLRPERLPAIREESVSSYLRDNRKLYQAVVVTGGEPTLFRELPAFLSRVKGIGLLAGLETNGTNPEMLESLIKGGTIDFVGMDVKAPMTWEKYRKAARIKDRRLLTKVRRSVRLLIGSSIDYEFRTTVVPGLHTGDDIIRIARQLKGAKRYLLQKFIPGRTLDSRYAKRRPYTTEEMTKLRDEAGRFVKSCELRNI